MTNNQLQTYQGMAFGELTQQDVATIRETIAKDANDSQFRLFMGVAKTTGANPLTNEIYAAVRGGQLTIQYGYDLYIRKAKEADGYQGYDVQLVHENDDFKLTREKDELGRSYPVVEKHDITFPRGKVIACYAIAYREGLPPMTVPMEVDEVEHFKRSGIGMQKTMWNNYFQDMFKKHVLKRALKQQFGLEFDDQTVDDNPAPDAPRERKDITPNEEIIDQEPIQQEEETPEDKVTSLRKEMKKKFIKLGIMDNDGISEYIKKNNVKLSNPATEAELVGLIELLDMHLEMQEAQQGTSDDDDILE